MDFALTISDRLASELVRIISLDSLILIVLFIGLMKNS